MDIYERISKNRTKIASIYDLAAVCYDQLCVQIHNQAEFLAKYIEYSENTEENNPNFSMLNQFSYGLSVMFLQKDKGYSMDEIVERTLQDISGVKQKLVNYEKKTYNEAAIAYYLLQAVDLYAENRTAGSLDEPLNKKYQKKSYVYRSNAESILTKAADQLNFRSKIKTTEIRHNFKCIRFLEKSELSLGMNPPKLVTLHIGENDHGRRAVVRDKKLKIAAIPFGKEKFWDFKKSRGNSFYVAYMGQQKKAAVKKALQLLEKAIRLKANIIIFPEYVCFPEMQEKIGDYLEVMYYTNPKKLQNLFLVVAGSGWTKDDNNVARVYSYSGKPLGEQYKQEPYDGEDEDGERWIEGLRNPGKESLIIEIPEIGSVMTAICRDVSNRNETEKVADFFEIDFLLVPAWSKSLHGGFEKQLGNITEMNMITSSLTCNCCSAVVDGKEHERGNVITPYKNGSIIEANVKIMKSKPENCEKCTGCIFCIPFSFETQDVDEGKIVGKITQNRL